MKFATCIALVFAVAGVARASTSDCVKAVDGTACATSCIASGTCMAAKCVPIKLRADGMSCSAENLCTSDDSCQNGVCIPGPAVVCPDKSACEIGICDPSVGCSTKAICPPPDMASPAPDLTTAPTDMAPPTDSPSDLAVIPIGDMCYYNPRIELATCVGYDGPYTYTLDAGTTPPPMVHVRGSSIGDCAVGGHDGREPAGIVFFASALVVIRRRRRAANTSV